MIILAGSLFRPAAAASGAGPRVTVARVLDGYASPGPGTHTGAVTKRIFIVEQVGRISIATHEDGAWKKVGIFLDIRAKVLGPKEGGLEQGLLGLAFAPDYARSGRFYVYYSGNDGQINVE